MDLTIVDSDIICATNINRQLQATAESVGRVKVEELANRLALINPAARITAINRAFNSETWPSFGLEGFDYVIDAIDSLNNKVLLIEQVRAATAVRSAGQGAGGLHQPPVLFASMGAAAKLDPTRIRVDLLENTRVCPLARHVRRLLRERGVACDFLCVYSDESPIVRQLDLSPEEGSFVFHGQKKRVNGSLVHITAIFGFMLSGLVIQDTVRRAGGQA
jgi:tRNA A37 threonylcarbamoyladenosine dehydratase